MIINIIDYFTEKWRHTPKPYEYNKYLQQKLKLESNTALEIRNTGLQPTLFVDIVSGGQVRFNKRKINQLPGFIMNLEPEQAALLLCKHVFFNFDFLNGLFGVHDSASIFDLFDTINKWTLKNVERNVLEADMALKILSLVFLQSGSLMKEYPFAATTIVLYRFLNSYGYLLKIFYQLDF